MKSLSRLVERDFRIAPGSRANRQLRLPTEGLNFSVADNTDNDTVRVRGLR